MKKLIGAALICVLAFGSVGAQTAQITYTDDFVAADTALNSERIDTVFSPLFDIAGWTSLQFFVDLEKAADTNWTDDTFFVDFQHSFDGDTWNTCLVDTLLDVGVGWSVLTLERADSVIGNYGRARMIHYDKLEATGPALFENEYTYLLKFWMSYKGDPK